MRARTGAGGCGLTSEPFGPLTAIGRAMPSLKGMSGLVSADFMAASAADSVSGLGAVEVALDLAAGACEVDLDPSRPRW